MRHWRVALIGVAVVVVVGAFTWGGITVHRLDGDLAAERTARASDTRQTNEARDSAQTRLSQQLADMATKVGELNAVVGVGGDGPASRSEVADLQSQVTRLRSCVDNGPYVGGLSSRIYFNC